jgi:hypothetical protein
MAATRIKYSATLANGRTISRNSYREYSHFWAVSAKGEAKGFSGGDGGFARTLELASKAAASAEARYRKHGGADVQIKSEIVEVKAEAA